MRMGPTDSSSLSCLLRPQCPAVLVWTTLPPGTGVSIGESSQVHWEEELNYCHQNARTAGGVPSQSRVGWAIRLTLVANLDKGTLSQHSMGCGCDSREGMLGASLTCSLSLQGDLQNGHSF